MYCVVRCKFEYINIVITYQPVFVLIPFPRDFLARLLV